MPDTELGQRLEGQVGQGLRFIEPLRWEEVLESWEAGEAVLSHWIEHYTERGFSSWRDWRRDSVKALQPELLRWLLYEVVNPMQSVPLFRGGPFRSWIKSIYQGSEDPTFLQIAEHPKIKHGDRVNQIVSSFPAHTFMIGLNAGGNIVIIDGMHRCCAITLAAQRNVPINAAVLIALADFTEQKIPLLGNAESPT